jgi:hypothetical protein
VLELWGGGGVFACSLGCCCCLYAHDTTPFSSVHSGPTQLLLYNTDKAFTVSLTLLLLLPT